MTRRLLPGLAVGVAVAAAAVPAQAAETRIGPDLEETGPASVALRDGNDTFWWDTAPGIKVRKQGEIRAIRIKGGTVQDEAARRLAVEFDPNYDITHWIVLRKIDGVFRPVANSEDVRLPIIGMQGVTRDTVTELRQPQDTYRVCAKPGDRVALASVGGFVPNVFGRGLPYQVFARTPGRSIYQWRAGGNPNIQLGKTKVRPERKGGLQLQMQAVLGTGKDARYTCQTKSQQRRGV